MPLPKMPTKPAALLSPKDYPTAEKAKTGKTAKVAVEKEKTVFKTEAVAKKPAAKPAAPAKPATSPAPAAVAAAPAQNARETTQQVAVVKAKNPQNKAKSGISRAADKSGISKMFVLDTNVLMHDPTCLFRFEEHDVYLPMITLEELDDHKKGMSEVARNARQVSRTLDGLVADISHDAIEHGIPLSKLGNKDAGGHLYFQTKLQNIDLPRGLPQGKADNQILGVVQALEKEFPGRPIVLVSKDINMRIKARAMGLPAEDYFNDHVLEDSDLLYTGIVQLPDDFWNKHGKGIETWQENKNGISTTFYRITGPVIPSLLVNQFVYLEPKNGEASFYGQVRQINGKTAVLQTLRDYGHVKHSVWGVTSRNREQNFALNLLMDPECDFVTLLGQAGTAKPYWHWLLAWRRYWKPRPIT
jgi:PhoH-like ATPase